MSIAVFILLYILSGISYLWLCAAKRSQDGETAEQLRDRFDESRVGLVACIFIWPAPAFMKLVETLAGGLVDLLVWLTHGRVK